MNAITTTPTNPATARVAIIDAVCFSPLFCSRVAMRSAGAGGVYSHASHSEAATEDARATEKQKLLVSALAIG